MKKEIALYVHIPFCKRKCGYCDFTTFSGLEDLMPSYVDNLITEINRKSKEEYVYKTIFIGGGTPTHLGDQEFEKLLKAISNLKKKKSYEYTIEANPESLSNIKIDLMVKYGVNRVSIGLQSTDDIILKNIGRIHDYETFLDAYNRTRSKIPNVSFDLITALPLQTMDNIKETVDKVIKLEPKHISCYSLILEDGTAFKTLVDKGKMILPDEDSDREYQDYVEDKLVENGYIKYEISNFALKGYESKHNITYWKLDEYVGCGVAAAGFENNIRYTNVKNIKEYISKVKNNENPILESYELSKKDKMEEFIFMGLRMNEGISIKKFDEMFEIDFREKYKAILDKYTKTEHLILEGDTLRFSHDGFDVSNYILSDFIE